MPQLSITTNKLTIDSNTTDFAKKKFKKVISLLPSASTINLIFNHENKRARVDATLNLPGKTYHAHAVEESFYICLKHLPEKLLRQFKKDKEKINES
jgi:ribosomal subunit interface protein